MLKRLSTVLLLGGLLGLTPTAATAAPLPPAGVAEPAPPAPASDLYRHRDDDHRRCWYRCDERDGRDRYRERDRRRHDYDRPRHRGRCWYRDRWGWYQAPCGRRHGWHHDGGWSGHHDHDSHATGGYDAHRRHPRG